MSADTVFIGGSRRISRLPAEVTERLRNIIDNGFEVIVGDANGADKAVQKFMADAPYRNVTVFCSGPEPRNNLGDWPLHPVTPEVPKGFQFYAAKDREMAASATYGLMIWDGKSAGTILNILRLVRGGKKAVLIDVPQKDALTFKTMSDWDRFRLQCHPALISDVKERATSDEWPKEPQFAMPARVQEREGSVVNDDALTADINRAFQERSRRDRRRAGQLRQGARNGQCRQRRRRFAGKPLPLTRRRR
jgi:hypothetical protein